MAHITAAIFAFSILFSILSCTQTTSRIPLPDLKNIAIVNFVSNEFLIYKRKIPTSETRFRISDWKTKEYLSNKALTSLKAKNPSKNFTIVEVSNPSQHTLLQMDEKTLKDLRNAGYDGAVVIDNAGVYNGGMELIPSSKGGFLMFVTYSITGKEYREILAQYSISLYELSEGKLLSHSAHSKNEYKFQDEIKVKEHKDYTINDLNKIKFELIKSIDLSIDEMTKKF